jgi:hypothetical protein
MNDGIAGLWEHTTHAKTTSTLEHVREEDFDLFAIEFALPGEDFGSTFATCTIFTASDGLLVWRRNA